MYRPAYPLQTARLLIRPLREADLDDLYTYHRRPDVVAYLPWIVRTREEVLAVIASRKTTILLEKEGDSLCLGVELRETGRIIGEVFLFWRSQPNAQGELGFVFHPDYHGKGYAREAAERMLAAGFEESGLHRIFGRCDVRNEASARLMGRMGMRLEAHFSGSQLFKGEWNEEQIYAMLRDEWLERRSANSTSGQPISGFAPTLPDPSILRRPPTEIAMQFFVHHAGQQQGPLDLETVRARLTDGSFLASDLAWSEGMAGWQPLSTIPALGGSPLPPALPPAQMSGYLTQQPPTSGLAIASLVLGFVSFVTVGLTSIPAVICGHLSLSRIKKSPGMLSGQGVAIAGLATGYFGLLIFILFLTGLTAGFVSGFNRAHERRLTAQSTNEQSLAVKSLSRAKQIALACKLYASDNDGHYPAKLEDLLPTYVADKELFVCPLGQGGSQSGYNYFGGAETDPENKVLLSSQATTRDHRRIVVHMDCTGELKRD